MSIFIRADTSVTKVWVDTRPEKARQKYANLSSYLVTTFGQTEASSLHTPINHHGPQLASYLLVSHTNSLLSENCILKIKR